MKLIKSLIIISWVTLSPIILLNFVSLINQLLKILNVCHAFDGNGFSDSALCVFPTISYFISIFLLFGRLGSILSLLRFIGLFTTVIYFIYTFIHNYKNPENPWKFSTGMMLLGYLLISVKPIIFFITIALHCITVFIHNYKYHNTPWKYPIYVVIFAGILTAISAFLLLVLFLLGINKQNNDYNKYFTPTETIFVCDKNYSLMKLDNNTVHEIHADSKSKNKNLQIDFIAQTDDENNKFLWAYKNDEREERLKKCKNIKGETIFSQYKTIEDFKSTPVYPFATINNNTRTTFKTKIKDLPYIESIFNCDDNHFIQFFLASSYVVDTNREKKDGLIDSTTFGKIDADTKTFTWELTNPSKEQKNRLTTCKNSAGRAFLDIFEEKLSATSVENNSTIDSDNDGLSDLEKKKIGTDMDNPDTDGDGYLDGEEVENGFNPLK